MNDGFGLRRQVRQTVVGGFSQGTASRDGKEGVAAEGEVKFMKMTFGAVVPFLFILGSLALAESILLVGKSYQIDRAKYPGKVAVCVTKESMMAYMEAIWDKDESKGSKLLHEIKNSKDIEDLKASGICTLISSFSQAKVIEKGIGVHHAEFAAFPFLPMWGYYDYFGAPVP
jgi:hypothetical protein